jgi:hypothetical protein
MNHLLVLIACSLMGCAQGPNDILEAPPMFTDVDPELQSYFDNFQSFSGGVSVAGITAGFTTLPNHVAGLCVWGGTYNEVRISDELWNAIPGWTVNQKQQLVSHELGHCALFLQHINNCSDGTTAPDGTESSCNEGNGMPLSIMNWQMFTAPQADQINGTYYEYLKLNEPIPQ